MTVPAEYASLRRQRFERGQYAIRPVQPEDIEDIRLWRNSQMDVLRQGQPITPDMQTAYYQAEIWPSLGTAQPRQILMTLVQDTVRIGYGGLVHIAWEHRRAEVSFLVAPDIAADEVRYGQAFDAFFELIKTMAFDDLDFHRLTTETYSSRPGHIARYSKVGFQEEGRLRQHVQVDGRYIDSLVHGCLRSDVQ